jgi:hypothetical protein
VDSSKPIDPWAQFAEMQKWMANNFPGFKAGVSVPNFPYEAADPTIAEIAVLAGMHVMASTLRDPGDIKAAINAAIKERAGRLTS